MNVFAITALAVFDAYMWLVHIPGLMGAWS